MFQRRITLLAIALIAVIATGCDSGLQNIIGGGTAGTPCATTVSSMSALRSAAATAGAGDVCLKPGTYSTSAYIPVASSVRLHGAGVSINYTGPRASLGLFNANGTHDILVEGFRLDGANQIAEGFRSQDGARHIMARNLSITNMGEGGVQFQQSDHVAAVGNKIWHAGYTFGWGSGINLWFGGKGSTSSYDSAAGFHAIIANNAVADIADASGNFSDGNGIMIDGGGALYPVLIAGNVVHDVRGRGISSIWNSLSLWVVNNTVVHASNADKCSYASFSVQGFHGTVRWINNISRPGCGPNYAQYDSSTGYSWTRGIDGNTANTSLRPTADVKVADPLLDATTFAPRPGSPAVGTAVDVRSLLGASLWSAVGAYLPTHDNIGAR